MSKQEYIAVLSQGVLDKNIINAIEGEGYSLMRINNYEGQHTHNFKRTITPKSSLMKVVKPDKLYSGRQLREFSNRINNKDS